MMASASERRNVPGYLKGTASTASRATAKKDTKPDIDAASLFSRDDDRPSFTLSLNKHDSTAADAPPPRAKTPPLNTHYALIGQHNGVEEVLDDSWDRVRVFVRVRPSHENEVAGGVQLEEGERQRITVQRGGTHGDGLGGDERCDKFMFDSILSPRSTQQDVYNEAVRPIVDDVLLGYNGSVMAYGQTGAGKTYTLSNMDPDAIGMTPRALADIFNKASQDVACTYNVFMSYVQIYMEVIKDLLMPSAEQLAIREDVEGVFLSNVHEVEVKSTKDCLKLLQQGDQNRVFASTEMNANSSRSHAIVIVTVFKRRKRAITRNENGQEVTGQATTMGRMFLVDLAGSERLKKSKSVGLRAQEAKAINLSLHMLGMCVNAKSDPNATHIPYRDSKLTRLLQESLGGNAKTSMIIAVSDTKEHIDETFHSLVFGSRAILVKTAPRVNQYVDLSVLNEKIAQQLTVEPPESALERALLDREEAVGRLERELNKERTSAQARTSTMQRRLEEALKKVAAAAKDNESHCLAIDAARRAHEADLQDASKREKRLQSELANTQGKLESVEEDLRQRNLEIGRLQAEVDRQAASVADANATSRRLETSLEESHQAHAAVSSEKADALREVHRAELELKVQLQKASDKHARAIETLQEEREAELKQLRAEHEAALAALNTKIDDITAHAQEAERARDSLAQQLHDERQERARMANLADDTRAELDAVSQIAKQQGDSLKREVDSKDAENTTLHQRMLQEKARGAALEDNIRKLQQMVQQQAAEAATQQQRHVTALVRAGDAKRDNQAAICIQRSWRRYQKRQLREHHEVLASDWARERQQMTHAQRSAAAQTGRTLVVQSVVRIEATMSALLMAFLVPTKVKQKVQQAHMAAGLMTPRTGPSAAPSSVRGPGLSPASSLPTGSLFEPRGFRMGKRQSLSNTSPSMMRR